MRTSIKRAVGAAVLAIAFTAGGGGTAQAADGCVGFPGLGGLAYHCLAANPILPTVSLAGSTPVGAEIPAFCYFVDCTEDTPVGTSVPFSISTSRPSGSVTVFRLDFGCSEDYYGGRYCGTYYELYYAGGSLCYFRSNDPLLSDVEGRSVRCVV